MTDIGLDLLLSRTQVGKLSLNNRMIMAPMTRSRAGAGGVQPGFLIPSVAPLQKKPTLMRWLFFTFEKPAPFSGLWIKNRVTR